MAFARRPADSQSAAAEAYRILRSSVKFAAAERPIRSVLVVDIDRAVPSDVAPRLAEAFARAGDRCVYVDATAGSGDEPGFADLIAGRADAAAIASLGSLPNLSVIAAGPALDADALASDRLPAALDALLTRNDYVVMRCAALPGRGDALALAPRVDATILVVTSGQTRRPRAIEARDALQRVGANVLGLVLIEAKRRVFW